MIRVPLLAIILALAWGPAAGIAQATSADERLRAPLNSDTFFWTEFTPPQGYASVDVYRNYVSRLRDVPRYFDERHRREAEERLGAAFDQRRFHDAILALGSVPLGVLEERMARLIADGGR